MKSDFEPRQVKPITVAIEVVPVIAVLFVFVMAIAGLLYHSVKKQNEIATTTSLHFARSGTSFFENDIREAVIEYSFWNEGAQNTIVDYNAAWVKDNILDWVIAGAKMDGCLIVGSQNRLIVGTSRDASHSYTDTSSFPDGLKKLIDAARSQPQIKGKLIPPVSGYFRDESGLYLAAAALIQWSDGRALPLDNNAPGVMVFYRAVTSSLLKGLQDQFLLDNLDLLSAAEPASDGQLPLEEVDGTVVGRLEWQVEETGTVMLYDLIIPILVLSVLLLVTVAYVVWRALNAAKRVQNYHDWLEFQAEDLREARNQAEAANRSKSHFLATMSHELRTPLNAIIGFSDLIRNVPGVPSQPDKVVEYVTDIHSSGQYLLALINDILDMSKIESKRFELYEEVARPDVLIDECTKLIRPDADSKSIAIRRTRTSFFLLCDERAVRQILINLLSNAIKFSPSNSLIQITISHKTGEGFTISIIDQGIGMSAEEIERAMLPFGQIRDAHVRENQGTGLGLNISRALTELHGGSLTLESRPGKGTKVSIHFPDHRVVQSPSA